VNTALTAAIPWPTEAGGLALRAIDALAGYTMVVPTGRLLGRLPTLASALDWRLGGRIAQRVAAQRFTGQSEERLLLLLPEHPWPVVVLLGFGPQLDPDVFSASLAQVRSLGGAHRAWLDPDLAPKGWRAAAPQWLRAAGEQLVAL
jgi:hypothetical protein